MKKLKIIGNNKTRRQKEMLIDDFKYIYTKQKMNFEKTKVYWVCKNRSCKARAITLVSDESL